MAEIVLETERLILRKPVIEDAEIISSYNQREDFRHFLPFDETNKDVISESVKKAIMQAIEDNSLDEIIKHQFVLIEKNTTKLIGDAYLHIEDKKARIATVGYGISPDFWNLGYMTEALKTVLKFGFKNLKMKRIYAWANIFNKASWRGMEKCGMKFEGCHRSEGFSRGEYYDRVYYSILDTDYKEMLKNG